MPLKRLEEPRRPAKTRTGQAMGDSNVISSARSRGHVVRRLLLLTWRYRFRALVVLVYQVILLAMTLGVVGLTGLAVDVMRAALDPAAPSPRWPSGMAGLGSLEPLSVLGLLGLSICVMALIGAALNYGYSLQVGRLVHLELVPAMRLELYQKLQRLSFRFFDAHPSGAIINRVTRDVQMLRSFVDGVVIQGAVLLLALGFFLAYMLSTHVWLTLASVMLLPLVYVTTVLFSRWARPAYLKNRELSDQMVRVLTESIEGISVIKVFGREAEQQRSFAERNHAVRVQQTGIFRAVSRFSPLVDLFNHLNLAVLMAYGVVLIARHEITLGDLIAFAGLLQQFARRASNMASIVDTLQQSLTGARRVFDVLDQPLGVEERLRPIVPGRLEGQVEFDQLGFDYREGIPVLAGVSLRVKAGECIGILGRAGSGKSTLLSLISRFYDPTRGRVLIDGIDLKDFALDALRRQIGIVFQETLLFRDTIANNIAFGNPGATRPEIEAAAKQAGADAFVRELPLGYDTVLDEGASNLSGGQRQRLAIARALLVEPPILVLDDPTTAIDAESEGELLRAVDGAIRGRTTFLVSGRVNALRRADRIIVLDAGRIVEEGTHAELAGGDGIYAATARLQGGDAESRTLLTNAGATP